MTTLSERNLEEHKLKVGGHGGSKAGSRRMSRKGSVVSSARSSYKDGDSTYDRRSVSWWRRLSQAYTFTTRISRSVAGNSQRSHSSEPSVRYENTYVTDPEEDKMFKQRAVTKILSAELERFLTDAQYAPRTVSILSQSIADEVKRRVKELEMQRYKIVCQVYIGSKNCQSMEMVSRAVWNTETDSFATASFQNTSLYAVALVHAVYFE